MLTKQSSTSHTTFILLVTEAAFGLPLARALPRRLPALAQTKRLSQGFIWQQRHGQKGM